MRGKEIIRGQASGKDENGCERKSTGKMVSEEVRQQEGERQKEREKASTRERE